MAMFFLTRRAPYVVLPLLLVASGCKSAPPSDPAIAAAVQQKISSDSAIAAEPIQASVQNAVVTLSGTVTNDAARALASNDAGSVPGVRTVLNNIVVQAPVAATPAPITPSPTLTPAPEQTSRRDRERDRRDRRDRERADQASARHRTTPTVADNTAPVAPPPVAPINSQPSAPPAPVFRTVTLDSGTALSIRLSQALNSGSAQEGQTFSGTLASDVLSPDGTVILSQGTPVSGRVVTVQEASHFKGNALLSLELTEVTRHGNQIAVSTQPFNQEGKGRGKNTAEKAGIGAAAGAILGGIFGGGKGAAIGAAAGGGGGLGINAITRGQQADLPAETLIRFRTTTPITVRVSSSEASSTPSARRPLQ